MQCTTWLSPSLPLGLFQVVADAVSAALGTEVTVAEGTNPASGPEPDQPWPAGADIAFCCAPTYLARTDGASLVGVALVADDPRNGGRPVYFSDLVVAASNPATSVAELAGATFAYNDVLSLSGWIGAHLTLAAAGLTGEDVQWSCAGAHVRSVSQVAEGTVEAAAVDSHALALLLRDRPDLAAQVRVLASSGPHPVQPVVAAPWIDPATKERIAAALLGIGPEALAPFLAVRYAPVTEAEYAAFGARLRESTAG